MSLHAPQSSSNAHNFRFQPLRQGGRDLLAIALLAGSGVTGLGMVTNLFSQATATAKEANQLAEQVSQLHRKIVGSKAQAPPPQASTPKAPISPALPAVGPTTATLPAASQNNLSPDSVCIADAKVNAAAFPELPGSQNGGNIRPTPSLEQAAVNTVRNGGAVLVLENLAGWTKVQICQKDANIPNGVLIGYMDSRFLQ